MSKQTRIFWRLVTLIMAFFSSAALYRIIEVTRILRISLLRPNWLILSIFLVVITLIELTIFGFTWNERVLQEIGTFLEPKLGFFKNRIVAYPLIIISILFYSWLMMYSPIRGFLMTDSNAVAIVLGGQGSSLTIIDIDQGLVEFMTPFTDKLVNTGVQWWLFSACNLIAAIILKIHKKGISWFESLLVVVLSSAVIYKVLSFLPSINSYPLSLNWSEGSRRYNASLLLSEKIYGQKFAISFIELPLNLVNSVPFWLGNLPIWAHRLWSVLFSLSVTAFTAYLFMRRLNISTRLIRWLFTAFCILYLYQEGGILPHMLLAVIVVMIGVSGKHPWRSLVSIVIASFWVGMERINWYPVPGMLAASFYMLEVPLKKYQTRFRYLLTPALWLITGLSAAIIGNLLVIWITGVDFHTFNSSLNSPLLWYRLFPNATYRFGVLPAILTVTLPIWLIVLSMVRKQEIDVIRLFGLVGMVLILFIGGLISSIKIGGGGDLHNMDVYMLLLLMIGGYVYFNRIIPDAAYNQLTLSWLFAALAVIFPIASAINNIQLTLPYNQRLLDRDLYALNSDASIAAEKGEVLFISQRQLLTFHKIKDIPISPDYEIMTLMEMVMSNNQLCLDQFRDDLHNHRFSLIAVSPQNLKVKGSGFAFGEENDVWLSQVAETLVCEYQTIKTYTYAGLQLYIPRQESVNCPLQ